MDSAPKLASKVIFKLAQVLAARLRFTNNALENAQEEIDQLKMSQNRPNQINSEASA